VANEILTGSGGGTDILVSEVASKYVHMLLADRASLRNHPAIIRLGSDLLGGATEHIAKLGLNGYDLMTSRTEIQAIANNALTTAEATVTPAPYRLAYDTSDLMRAVDPLGITGDLILPMSIAMSASMTLTNLIATGLSTGLSTVGTTTVRFTHDTFLAAQFALFQALVPGPYLSVLKPIHFTDWQADLEARGGNTQWRAATEAMMALRGPGAQGVYNNIEVFSSNQVQSINAGADWASAMFGIGCIAYKEVNLGPAPRSQFVVLDVEGVIRVAEKREETTGETFTIGHYNVGVVKVEAGRGRTIVAAQ
jgi:hypothetical protein